MLQKSLKDILHNKDLISYNDPFPHFIINNLFDDEILSEISNNETLIDVKGTRSVYNNSRELKVGITPFTGVENENSPVMKILNFLNGQEFVDFLRNLTSIEDLSADPTFLGAGVHMIPPGGKLGIHIDFSRHPSLAKSYRRCNVLLYLNKNWAEEYGGALELWSDRPKAGGKCIKKVYPIFNTLIIFGTAKNSWHGHPSPLNTPEGVFRKSLATYYYSSNPGNDLEDHSTIFAE